MIDAHVHLWQLGRNACTWPTPDLNAIYRDFELDDARNVLTESGVEAAILVQSQEDPADTAWLLKVAQVAEIAAVIGWADLSSPADVAALAAHSKLRGLRPMVQGCAADWYDDPVRDAGFAAMAAHGLVLDALIRPVHLPALARLADRYPGLTIVIDHAAKPDPGDPTGWREAIAQAAARPNIACKLSGLLTELAPGQDAAALDPIHAHLWQCFGPERLLWGSDWPVVTLRGDYPGWLALARAWVPAQHHHSVFDTNARRLYRLA
ncbi:amidohydrolase family protein [Sphingomonas sp. MMS12-HWE2-04]|uniref:amidohydrolase family protein n=1 Tax=Sphingomonas sp. MMS12-HWE2-04 TaxID=3234199 RepID=UPI00384E2AA7